MEAILGALINVGTQMVGSSLDRAAAERQREKIRERYKKLLSTQTKNPYIMKELSARAMEGLSSADNVQQGNEYSKLISSMGNIGGTVSPGLMKLFSGKSDGSVNPVETVLSAKSPDDSNTNIYSPYATNPTPENYFPDNKIPDLLENLRKIKNPNKDIYEKYLSRGFNYLGENNV